MEPPTRAVPAPPESHRNDPTSDVDGAPRSLQSGSKEIPGGLPPSVKLKNKESYRSYHRPIRTDRSSVESTSGPDQARDSQVTPSDDGPETGIIAIGMALGSPTHPPDYGMTAWRPQFTTTVTAGSPESQIPTNEETSPKSKSRKWGIFGRSRSKKVKGSSNAANDGQIMSPSASSPLGRSTSTMARPHMYARGGSATVTSPPHRSIARSHTEPMLSDQAKVPRNEAFAPKPPSKDDISGSSRTTGTGPAGGTPPLLNEPLLDVEIPSITLERYSVMFGHLLEHKASSLLARRQATQDRLKAIKEGEPHVLESSLSPDSASASPRNQAPQPRGRPMESFPRPRSNTSPAMIHSPVRSNFQAPATSIERRGTRHIAESSLQGGRRDEPTDSDKATERPQLISKFHRRSLSSQHSSGARVSVDQPASITENEHFRVEAAPQEGRRMTPSAWNTIHPPLEAATPRSFASRNDDRSLPPSPVLGAIGGPSHGTPETVPQDPVEVSIARQISVSRQQRALLGPLQRHGLDQKHLSETKSSTPRLVDPKHDPASPKAMHRKSERVIVERA